MEEGFRVDGTQGGVASERWMPGPPETSFWAGTNTDKARIRQVRTFCCSECGCLESYAAD
jgi:hypothetical protein